MAGLLFPFFYSFREMILRNDVSSELKSLQTEKNTVHDENDENRFEVVVVRSIVQVPERVKWFWIVGSRKWVGIVGLVLLLMLGMLLVISVLFPKIVYYKEKSPFSGDAAQSYQEKEAENENRIIKWEDFD